MHEALTLNSKGIVNLAKRLRLGDLLAVCRRGVSQFQYCKYEVLMCPDTKAIDFKSFI